MSSCVSFSCMCSHISISSFHLSIPFIWIVSGSKIEQKRLFFSFTHSLFSIAFCFFPVSHKIKLKPSQRVTRQELNTEKLQSDQCPMFQWPMVTSSHHIKMSPRWELLAHHHIWDLILNASFICILPRGMHEHRRRVVIRWHYLEPRNVYLCLLK